MKGLELKAGVHHRPGFLEPGVLKGVRQAMAVGQPESAEVLGDGVSREDQVRRATSIEVDEATLALVEGLLDEHRGVLAGEFGLTLSSREGPSFLRYAAGDHYRPHRDRADVPSWPDAARRLVAVVVFLNSSRDVDPSGEFEEGVLRLFPHHDAPLVEVRSRAGTLVAFHADRLHEVTPVRQGTREAIVDWYYG